MLIAAGLHPCVIAVALYPCVMQSSMLSREHSVLQVRKWAEAGRLHALVDACDTPSVPIRARQAEARGGDGLAVSLYKGRSEQELWSIAPYLFAVDVDTFDWITGALWSNPWGCLLLSDATTAELRAHFRQFLIVKAPLNQQWYFRFYDPRVLQAYLETCTDDELELFFGPVRAIGVTETESYGVRVMSVASTTKRTAPSIAVLA